LSDVNSLGTIVSILVKSGGIYTLIGISISERGRVGRVSCNVGLDTVAFFEEPQLSIKTGRTIIIRYREALKHFMRMD
jgi:hypothetical protein